MVRRDGIEPSESLTWVLQTHPLPSTVYRRILLVESGRIELHIGDLLA